MNSELECTICFGVWDSKEVVPRLLYLCGHNFCDSCLRDSYRAKDDGSGGHVICPLCDKKYDLLNIDGINNFPKIYALISLGEQSKNKQNESKKKQDSDSKKISQTSAINSGESWKAPQASSRQ